MSAHYQPPDGAWEARVRASFARQGLMAHLGASIAELEPGRCVIVADYADHLSQQNGFFHAGVTSALADSAGGYAGFTLFDAATDVVTVEFKINLLTPAAGRRIVATGTVLRRGRQLTTCEVRVAVDTEAGPKLCATMLQTLMAVRRDGPGLTGSPH